MISSRDVGSLWWPVMLKRPHTVQELFSKDRSAEADHQLRFVLNNNHQEGWQWTHDRQAQPSLLSGIWGVGFAFTPTILWKQPIISNYNKMIPVLVWLLFFDKQWDQQIIVVKGRIPLGFKPNPKIKVCLQSQSLSDATFQKFVRLRIPNTSQQTCAAGFSVFGTTVGTTKKIKCFIVFTQPPNMYSEGAC